MKNKAIYYNLPGYYPGKIGYTLLSYSAPQWMPAYGAYNIPKIGFDSSVLLKMPEYNNGINGDFKIKGSKNKLNLNNVDVNSLLQTGTAFLGSIGNSFSGVKSSNDILNETGTSFANGIGFGYNRYNDIDYNGQMKELNRENTKNTLSSMSTGASLGNTIGGPIGAGIGAVVGGIAGLFGGHHRRKKMRRRLEEARIRGINLNNYNLSSAESDYLEQQYYNENGNTQDDLLYAKNGKDVGYSQQPVDSNKKVYTSQGRVDAKPNSRVAVGESIIDNIDDVSNTTGYVVKTGKPGKDTNLANLNDSTIVLGHDIDWRTGSTFKDLSLPYTQALEKINKKYENRTNKSINKLRGVMGKDSDAIQLQEVNKIKQPIVDKLKDLSQQLAYQHKYTEDMLNYSLKYPGFGKGKPGYIEPMSWQSNAIPMGLGMLTSLGQYFDAKNQSIHTPDIYAGNSYERAALQKLSELRINPYLAIQNVYDQSHRNRYNINRAGGLSGALKYMANVAAGLGTQALLADMIYKAQEMNNKYRSDWASAALNAGNAQAARRQSANQYNTEYAAQAHAARQQGMQMGIRNFLDYIQQYAANEYKRKTGNGMLSLYQQKVDMDRDAIKKRDEYTYPDIVPTRLQPINLQSLFSTVNSPGTLKLYGTNRNYNNKLYTGIPNANVPAYTYPANKPINFMNYTPQEYVWNNMFR